VHWAQIQQTLTTAETISQQETQIPTLADSILEDIKVTDDKVNKPQAVTMLCTVNMNFSETTV